MKDDDDDGNDNKDAASNGLDDDSNDDIFLRKQRLVHTCMIHSLIITSLSKTIK